MIIVNVRYINDDPTLFIPRRVLTVKGDEQIWLTINRGRKPPVRFYKVLSNGDNLGVDGQYLTLEISKDIEVLRGDILTLERFDMYVAEVLPDPDKVASSIRKLFSDKLENQESEYVKSVMEGPSPEVKAHLESLKKEVVPSQQAIPGFDILMVPDVPMREVWNADTVKTYPAKESGSYISKDGKYLLQPERAGEWRLLPATDEESYNFFKKYSSVIGDLKHCLFAYSELTGVAMDITTQSITVQAIMEATGIKYNGRFFNHPKTNSHANIIPVLRELAEWKPYTAGAHIVDNNVGPGL